MKKLQAPLKAVLKTLASLTQKVEQALEQFEAGNETPTKPAKKAKAVKAAKPSKTAKVAKATKAPKAEAPAEAAGQGTVLDTVMDAIKKAKNGASIEMLKAKTNLEARQLSNALYKLTKKGVIEARSRGVYFKK